MSDEDEPWWHQEGEPEPGDGAASAADSASEVLGSAAEEALKLLTALRERIAAETPPAAQPQWMDLLNGLGVLGKGFAGGSKAWQFPGSAPGQIPGSGHLPGHDRIVEPGEAAACSYCPICQMIAVVKSVQPETVERLTTAFLEMADALREAADSRLTPRPGPTVNRIRLDDDAGQP